MKELLLVGLRNLRKGFIISLIRLDVTLRVQSGVGHNHDQPIYSMGRKRGNRRLWLVVKV